MSITTEILPLSDTVAPADAAELAAAVRGAHDSATPVYPIGGATSLDFGLPAMRPGLGLSLGSMNRVIDYPARDMTITVEAGVTMKALAEQMAGENQRLPIDVPHAQQATIGGVIATNWGGPRRYGSGTIRDYVIGIHAVDGRGMLFRGGGRVVKNVAGYDFCKLLVGSLGSLGVITQVTLRVKPVPEMSAFLSCEPRDAEQAEALLAALVTSQTIPTAIELLAGPAWQAEASLACSSSDAFGRLLVGLEGTRVEVDWMLETLTSEWREQGAASIARLTDDADEVWGRLSEFPASGEAAVAVRASLPASALVPMIAELKAADPECSLQAHAGNGIVIARFSDAAMPDVARLLVSRLQPAARSAGGHMVVVSAPKEVELTRQAVWGGIGEAATVMRAVKREFDPQRILNPGRFVFEAS